MKDYDFYSIFSSNYIETYMERPLEPGEECNFVSGCYEQPDAMEDPKDYLKRLGINAEEIIMKNDEEWKWTDGIGVVHFMDRKEGTCTFEEIDCD